MSPSTSVQPLPIGARCLHPHRRFIALALQLDAR
jgi:hypothetical protein